MPTKNKAVNIILDAGTENVEIESPGRKEMAPPYRCFFGKQIDLVDSDWMEQNHINISNMNSMSCNDIILHQYVYVSILRYHSISLASRIKVLCAVLTMDLAHSKVILPPHSQDFFLIGKLQEILNYFLLRCVDLMILNIRQI